MAGIKISLKTPEHSGRDDPDEGPKIDFSLQKEANNGSPV